MDIYSFSDLLYALAKQENEVLKSYGIQHRPTIGNQYFAQRSTKNRTNKTCTRLIRFRLQRRGRLLRFGRRQENSESRRRAECIAS